jgi:hypothetical protein
MINFACPHQYNQVFLQSEMKKIYTFLALFLVLAVRIPIQAQTGREETLNTIFGSSSEVYFTFHVKDKGEADRLTEIISIDNYRNGEVFAYANRQEFSKFLNYQYSYTILPHPSSLNTDAELNMGNPGKGPNNYTVWNFYPTYSQYLSYMAGFASAHPTICKVDTIGTTVQGRLLLAVKISDSVNVDRQAPQFFYTSSIHGDELTGYIMMLHLIDSLLTGYGTVPRITNMVNKYQIYINPLANPDGTYHGGDNTVANATRYNYNGVDMNRNYPDPAVGPHPDGLAWQPETVAFMNYADNHHFSLSANFHGGAEVFNYPWDTWAKLNPDDTWWQFVGREFADTIHLYSPSTYFDDLQNGITNGYAWYRVTGGRQDYMNYFKHCREVTIEISATKTPSASTLLTYWNYDKRSLLNHIEEVMNGINGKITDSVTGLPLRAKVYLSGHDIDSTWVYSSLPSGWYFRPIAQGTWNVTYSAPGYNTKTVSNVSVVNRTTTRVNVRLVPATSPNSLAAIPVNINQVNLSWARNSLASPVMIAYNTSSTFGTPVNGTAYSPGSTIPGGGTVIYNGSGTTVNQTGLNTNTTYYYQAWSVLTGTSYSGAIAASATTFCTLVSAFPWSEGFENAGSIPSCWTQEQVNSSGVNWTFTTGGHNGHPSAAHAGTYNAQLYDATAIDNRTRLVSPPINLNRLLNPVLTFWHTQAVWSGYQDLLNVYYRTSATGAWIFLKVYSSSITAWTQETLTLPESSGTYYIAFDGNAISGYGVCIDDVSITGTLKTLTVTPSNQNVTASAGTTPFTLTSNTSWTATSDQTWCTVTPSGTGNGTITATFTQNTDANSRTATVTTTVTGLAPVTTTVTQAGAPLKTLNLSLYLEGFYNTATGMMNQAQECLDGSTTFNKFSGTAVDSLSVLLANPTAPWAFVYQAHGVLVNASGNLSLTIPSTYSGSYYIAIRQRNSVETWSAAPVSFAGSTISYNFTTSAGQAFGNNEKRLIPESSIFAIYMGDITSMGTGQDGYVDIFDNNADFNAGQSGAYGYLATDLTGDGFVDIFDQVIVFNNMQTGVGMNTPPNPAKK